MMNSISYVFKTIYRRSFVAFYRKMSLGSFGYGSLILKPLNIDGGHRIYIGSRVFIAQYAWLAAMPLTRTNSCRLTIKNGSHIGHFNHIYCTHSITIENDVLTADKVYITDNLHNYEDVMLPILCQPIKQLKTVVIGSGAWLGENVCVIGANVGKGSVVGANSVVTHDIPDYCVAVGVPAKVIKKYNFQTKIWEKVY